MLLIDCITYNGDNIIELRLEYLFDIIDIFIITEAGYTFSGVKKDCFFIDKNVSIFEKYKSKIIFIKIDKFPDEFDDDFLPHKDIFDSERQSFWFNEFYQRNYVKKFLTETINDDYICLICDCDEIPSINVIQAIKNNYSLFNRQIYLGMDFFYYNFKWKLDEKWIRSFVINNIGLKNINLSYARHINLNDHNSINNAGWHCSFFSSIINIINKLKSYSHQEFNNNMFTTIHHISKSINKGTNLFNDNKLIEYDTNNLPELFQKYNLKIINKQKYVFTNKWHKNNSDSWHDILKKFKNKPNLEFLEIGSFEGQSAVWLLDNILTDSTSRLTCIDTFEGSIENSEEKKEIYNYFTFNLSNFKNKINVIINDSKNALKQLSMHNLEKYDFIYINGDHRSKSVIFDAILSFDLLKKDGIIIFDHYLGGDGIDSINNAKIGIDCFLLLYKNDIEIIYNNYQIAILKK